MTDPGLTVVKEQAHAIEAGKELIRRLSELYDLAEKQSRFLAKQEYNNLIGATSAIVGALEMFDENERIDAKALVREGEEL